MTPARPHRAAAHTGRKPKRGLAGKEGLRIIEERCPLDSFHGRVHLAAIRDVRAEQLGDDEDLASFRPEGAVFFDLETTGLSTGGASCAFLFGAAHLEGDLLVMRQYLLEDLRAEVDMLREVHGYLGAFDGVVTYNGKRFDAPLLRARLAARGVAERLDTSFHLDLLTFTRRRWGGDLPSCRLKEVERELLGIRRVGDVEGRDIPPLYGRFLATGERRLLDPVLFHNLLDVKSLVALTVLAAGADGEHLVGGDASPLAAPRHRRQPAKREPACSPGTEAATLERLARILERSGRRRDADRVRRMTAWRKTGGGGTGRDV